MKVPAYLKGFYYFYITAKHLSIKKAAEELSVTQAAVSQQVRLLESELDVQLFERRHRAMALSDEGAHLLPHVRLAFESIQRGVNELAGDNNPDVITISVLPSFASRWLIPRLGRFYQAYPGIKVNLTMTDVLESFSDHNVDLAIRFGEGRYQGLYSKALLEDYIYPACHPRFLKEHPVSTIDDLQGVRLLDDAGSSIGWSYWFREHGAEHFFIKPENHTDYDGSHYMIESALSAQGIAMVRHSLAADTVNQGQLMIPLSGTVKLPYQYYLCAPRHYFRRAKVQCFCSWLEKEVAAFRAKFRL